MALPKLQHKTFSIEVPSTKSKINVRPILAKEAKLLLNARATQNYNDILKAIKDIIKACIVGEFNINTLTVFDLEYVYAHLYGLSTNEPYKVAWKDNEDEKTRTFDLDFSKIKIEWPEKDLKVIKLSDTINLHLTYPTIDLLEQIDFAKITQADMFEKFAISCLSKIYDGDKVYDVKSESPADVKAWLDDFPSDAYRQLNDFFINLPTIYYEVSWTNDKSKEVKGTLTNLNDIFRLV